MGKVNLIRNLASRAIYKNKIYHARVKQIISCRQAISSLWENSRICHKKCLNKSKTLSEFYFIKNYIGGESCYLESEMYGFVTFFV